MDINISSTNQINYSYTPLDQPKGKSLIEKMMSPLREAIGESIGNKLGKIKLSKEEIGNLKDSKAKLIESWAAKSLTIKMQNKNGKETHRLDGIFIKNPSESEGIENKDKKYIVVFYGMGDCYEKHLDSMNKLAEDSGANVISFNYRGKMDSNGTASSAKDYIEDGKAFYDFLLKSGANPDNILFFGHSLGGGVATKVNEELNFPAYLIPESTFSTMKKAVKYKEGSFTAWIFKKTGWNIDNVKALKNAAPGKVVTIVNRRDPTIDYEEASLHKGLKDQEVGQSIKVIKIGKKKLKESVSEADVKVKGKKINVKSDSIEGRAQNEDYANLQTKIKKAGWMKFLRHPHQMIMDQPQKPSEVKLPEGIEKELAKLKNKAVENPELQKVYDAKKALADDLNTLNQKYAKEDKYAYDEMINVIKFMLKEG